MRGEKPEDFMIVFLENIVKYSALLGVSAIVASAPAMADSSDSMHHILAEQRARLLTNYDRIWKETDDLKHKLAVLSHEKSEDTRRAESDLETELKHNYEDLHQIELDIRDLN
jgi:hypothetical protein